MSKASPRPVRTTHGWTLGAFYDFCRICGIHRRQKKASRGRKPDFFYRVGETANWDTRMIKCVDPRQGKLFETHAIASPAPAQHFDRHAPARSEDEATQDLAPVTSVVAANAPVVTPTSNTDLWDPVYLEAHEDEAPVFPDIPLPLGVVPPLRVGYKLLHPLEDRKDFRGLPGCDVTFGVLDRRRIGQVMVNGKLTPPNPDGDIITHKMNKIAKQRELARQSHDELVWPDEEDLF